MGEGDQQITERLMGPSMHGSWLAAEYGKDMGATRAKMTNSFPNQVFVDAAESSARKYNNDQKRKAAEAAKE